MTCQDLFFVGGYFIDAYPNTAPPMFELFQGNSDHQLQTSIKTNALLAVFFSFSWQAFAERRREGGCAGAAARLRRAQGPGQNLHQPLRRAGLARRGCHEARRLVRRCVISRVNDDVCKVCVLRTSWVIRTFVAPLSCFRHLEPQALRHASSQHSKNTFKTLPGTTPRTSCGWVPTGSSRRSRTPDSAAGAAPASPPG